MYDGKYRVSHMSLFNDVTPIYGTDEQRTIRINSTDVVLPQENFTLLSLANYLTNVVSGVVAGSSVTADTVTQKMTYTFPASTTITVTDPILQEVLGLQVSTGTSFVSKMCSLAPYYYLAIQVNGTIPKFNDGYMDYTIHVSPKAHFGEVIRDGYSVEEIVEFVHVDKPRFRYFSRGREFFIKGLIEFIAV